MLLAVVAPLLVAAGLVVARDSVATPEASSPTNPPQAVVARRGGPVPPTAPTVTSPSPPGGPARGVRPDTVVVPSLGVRAPVSLIRTEDGALNPPADPLTVGWWSGGARPGSTIGAAVVTGHTVHTGGGAFDDLEQLEPGDDVVVLAAGGDRAAYDVTSVRVLSRAELARESADVFGRSGPGRLVLITCEDWDGTSYRSNVVVTAHPTRG